MKLVLLLSLGLSLFGSDYASMKAAFEEGKMARAITYARTNAMKGNVNAMYDLGLLYYAKGSLKEAETWLGRSVKNGGKGELAVSIILFSQCRNRADYKRVMTSLIDVEQGPVRDALMAVSRDLSENRNEASAEAYLTLGKLFYADRFVAPNPRIALFLVNQAAKKGDKEALELMGDAYWRSPYTQATALVAPRSGNALNIALEYYGDAAKLGNLEAMAKMGRLHIIGPRNVRRTAEGVALILKSANEGSSLGAQMAAELYIRGEGVRADRTQAIAWYEKATEICEVNKILADYYRQGEKAQQYAKAYEECAEKGSGGAEYHLLFEPF